MKIVAIIQARMGSTRLPGKVLADLNGHPMLALLLTRIGASPLLNEIVVAIPEGVDDDILADWLQVNGIRYFRGNTEDVLGRFYKCAAQCQADIVVRVTADDPLKDPKIIDYAIQCILDDPSLDYVSNTLFPTYPEGLDIEVFKLTVLKQAYLNADLSSEREHVTPYIWKNRNLFKTHNFENDRNLSAWRWTVDKPEDLLFVRSIMSKFKDCPLVSYVEVIQYLDSNPNLLEINTQKTIRNEGYIKSTMKEGK